MGEKNVVKDIDAGFIAVGQNWLEDNISEKLYESGYETAEKYTNTDDFKSKVLERFSSYINTRLSNFNSQLEKLKTN